MSDFSELCPLFSTGVFNEITFPFIGMTGVSAGVNALLGTLTQTHLGAFTFGRTIVVTGAFAKRIKTSDAGGVQKLILMHHTSQLADGTAFGTLSVTVTCDGFNSMTWVPFENVTARTFTSSEILGFTMAAGTILSAGTYDLIVRYKDK